jgi:uncharacterized protein YihD (DUF1040 family)
MRDPARIDIVLEALRTAWRQEPDLRLGQLLINAVRPPSPCPELFYAEDDKLIEGLARYMAARQSAQQ